jgi:Scavenger receptor cysteine-rich domain
VEHALLRMRLLWEYPGHVLLACASSERHSCGLCAVNEGKVRIVADPVVSSPPIANAGRLEVRHAIGWGAICSKTSANTSPVSTKTARVICNSLGKTGGTPKVVTTVSGTGNAATGIVRWALTANCAGTETALNKCPGYKLAPAPQNGDCDKDLLIMCK